MGFRELIGSKKGGEKVLSLFWISIMTIVGLVISLGASMFYGAEIDIKEVEAEILSERILGCVANQGVLLEGFFEEGFDIFSYCNLNKASFGKEGKFYFNVSVFDEQGGSLKEITEGVSFEIQCGLKESGSEVRDGAGCFRYKKSIFYYDMNDKIKKGEIKILTGSKQK